jgi:uncharacterized membrane protein YfhO
MTVDNPAPTFNPNTHLLAGIQSVSGYDSLHTRRYEDYWAVVDPGVRAARGRGIYGNVAVRPQVYSTTLASLLNVRYVAVQNVLTTPAGFKQVYSGEISIYENQNALPRTFLVGRATVLSPGQVLQRLGSAGFDPRREVLLEKAAPGFTPESTDAGNGEARLVDYRRNSVTIEADVTRPAWLVLADRAYPGWSATMDGKPQEIYTADYILRAVPLPEGHHRVTFSYLPSFFLPSLALSLVTLIVVMLGLVRGDRWGK